ncbi:MAG TPA: histidine kinase [Steroidobacteraceae bacterium]|nr:histidine kinase [Steroidobacteraceae bacterium]
MASIPSALWPNAAPLADDEPRLLLRRRVLALATLFWGWVTLTGIAYHEAMRVELAEMTGVMLFFPWQYRLLQHALMLPVLLTCYSVAFRIGWRPGWRRVPQQLALAVGFSLLMYLAILVGGHFLHVLFGAQPDPFSTLTKSDWAMWAASGAMHLLAYGFGLALITVLEEQRRYHQLRLRNSELRRDWAGARLAALRSQLSPHTLLNVLHTIQARITGEPEVAESLIASLGDLLRGLLEAGERDFGRLQDELQFVELYLGLQRGRFADRLTVRMNNDADVPGVWVPSLILQPLVENAVVHGLADHGGPVRIDVTWDLSPYRLQLQVVNSIGPGKAPGAGGFGLRNVRERLAVQFGGRAVLASGPGEDSTWVATLHLPVLREWSHGSAALTAVESS